MIGAYRYLRNKWRNEWISPDLPIGKGRAGHSQSFAEKAGLRGIMCVAKAETSEKTL